MSVMDAIAINSKASQRDLSRETGLNLAKVNFLLRRLAEKGFVKLRNVQKNPNKLGYLYILTPRGLSEKSRLTVRFAARTWREYSRTIERLRKSLTRLVGSGGNRVLLLGASEVVDMIFEASADIDNLEIIGIIDPTRDGEKRRGVPVVSAIVDIEFDWAVPCDHTESSLSELAKEVGIEEEKLWLV
ncbi:MAG: winged helix-turn-helix transcriptional regulator [Deltaproteobacteria bacterium]|nr:winged helix-turn-helix transcriptional regulator [Deltaproteobacteria bacterium]